MTVILALFGFARHDAQASRPPLFAYLLAVPVAIFAGWIIEWTTLLAEWATFGYVSRTWASVIARSVGVIAVLMLGHGLYRAVVHMDDLSWGGWIRRQFLSGPHGGEG
jgi:purine-cytosine permease-like protein